MSNSDFERLFAGDRIEEDGSDEVANDAIQLVVIATFNGLCRLTAAIARYGLLSPGQVRNIHGAMMLPLDDPVWRDYSFIAGTRDDLEKMMARAMRDANESSDDGD